MFSIYALHHTKFRYLFSRSNLCHSVQLAFKYIKTYFVLDQDRGHCQAVTNMAMNRRVP